MKDPMSEAATRVTQKIKPAKSRDSAANLSTAQHPPQLTFEQLTDVVSEAAGYSNGADITFVASRSLPRTVRATVTIHGTTTVLAAGGTDHRQALIALLTVIEKHHRDSLQWHKERCTGARALLDRYGLFYQKSNL
jgi:dienelactone hydrolase